MHCYTPHQHPTATTNTSIDPNRAEYAKLHHPYLFKDIQIGVIHLACFIQNSAGLNEDRIDAIIDRGPQNLMLTYLHHYPIFIARNGFQKSGMPLV
jgi:hypothetical protein